MNWSRVILVFLLNTVWFSVNAALKPMKQALLIGIANYAGSVQNQSVGINARRVAPNWPGTSADRDRTVMRHMLTEQGFVYIDEIANQEATCKGINQKIETFIARLQPGDVVVIFYAGHGQQVTDNNGDEKDGYDEALVPYDAPAALNQQPNYRGEKHIRDDQIGQWVERIRTRIGPKGHLLLLVDSCHSGTINRADAVGRGGMLPLRLPTHRVATSRQNPVDENSSGYLERTVTKQPLSALGKFVLISGASANEYNQETQDEQGEPIGSLTYALSKAFRQVTSDESYARFFERISAFIAEESLTQTPTIEGDRQQLLFGGDYVIAPATFTLTKVAQLGQGMVQIAGGLLSGLLERARIAFYPAGAGRGGAPLALGRVTKSSLTASWVTIDSGKLVDERPLQVIETERSFGNWQIKVTMGPDLPAAWRKALAQTFLSRPAIRIGEKADLRLERNGHRVRLREITTNQVLATTKAVPDAIPYLERRIMEWGQARFMRRLAFTNPQYVIRTELLPVRLDDTNERVEDTLSLLRQAAYPRFPVNTQAQLTISNVGSKDVYVTLIDIMPNDRIAVLLPDGQSADSEGGLLIRAGQRSQPIFLRFSAPYGVEVYKFIATPRPLMLHSTIDSRGNERDAEVDNPLVQLFGQTYRGQEPDPIPLTEGSITTLTFKITPPVVH